MIEYGKMYEMRLSTIAFRTLGTGECIYGVVEINQEEYLLIGEKQKAGYLLLPARRIAGGEVDDVLLKSKDYVLSRDEQGQPDRILYYPSELGWCNVWE